MDRPSVSIVIPVWNAVDVTRRCLQALRPTLQEHDQVIVVDDGSTDRTADVLADQRGWIEVVTHTENRGFAAACNDGAAKARHELVIFLNNDTVPAGDWIQALVAPFADSSIGAAGPMSNGVSGSQLAADPMIAGCEPAQAADLWHSRFGAGAPRWNDCARLVGFCLAVRTEVFGGLGGFDEGYGQGGYEDDDLCLRILLADYRLVTVETAFVYHQLHASFEANDVSWLAVQRRNRLRYQAKLDRSFAVSVLLHCGSDSSALLQTLLSVADVLTEVSFEVVLLVTDAACAAPVLELLDGDVTVVDVDVADEAWTRGQWAATGLRRISMRAGDVLTAVEAATVLAGPIGCQLGPAA